jgi:hypothetical protein
MLQANLAIILTFITTLIDELSETKDLSNAKLLVIGLAFVTVIILFNFSYKEEQNKIDPLKNLAEDLKNNINMIKRMPNQIQDVTNTGSNQLQNITNQHIRPNQPNSTSSGLVLSSPPVKKEPFDNIYKKYYFNNSTQNMKAYFK